MGWSGKPQFMIMTYSWVNLVVPKNWVAYFSAISGRKLDLTTVLRSCWPREWRRRGFLASGPFFSLFLTFAHEKNHFPVVKSGFWGHISHLLGVCFYWEVVLDFRFGHFQCPNEESRRGLKYIHIIYTHIFTRLCMIDVGYFLITW